MLDYLVTFVHDIWVRKNLIVVFSPHQGTASAYGGEAEGGEGSGMGCYPLLFQAAYGNCGIHSVGIPRHAESVFEEMHE